MMKIFCNLVPILTKKTRMMTRTKLMRKQCMTMTTMMMMFQVK